MFKKIFNWFKVKRNRSIVAAAGIAVISYTGFSYWKRNRKVNIPTARYHSRNGISDSGEGSANRAAGNAIDSIAEGLRELQGQHVSIREYNSNISEGIGEVERGISELQAARSEYEKGIAAARERIVRIDADIDEFERRRRSSEGTADPDGERPSFIENAIRGIGNNNSEASE